MAHYAFITNGIVTEVIVGVDESELIEGLDPETWYGNLRGQVCKRTSYNNNIRGIYAAVGFTYNATEDIFILPQPYPSWIRSNSFWNPPVAYPNDGKLYEWNEENQTWDLDETAPK